MKKFAYILSIFGFLFHCVLFSQVTSNFETSIEDWYSEGDGDYVWEIGTGNPGNNFRVNDDATGNINLGYAPAKFLGNWSGATTSDYISADIYLNQISGGYISNNFVFQIEGPGGKAKALIGTNPPFYTWATYSVTMDPANWTMLEGNWADLLQLVNTLIVRMEYINGNEWVRLDNVHLSFTPVIVPVLPEICSDFEAGAFDGWSFSGAGGVTNQSSGGNPGRYLSIANGTGTAIAQCPPKFLGDWSLLDNHAAEIQVDLIVTNYSGSVYLHDYFIKIEGPGGIATFPIDNAIEEAFNKWTTFSFPIKASSWTVSSGNWSSLISNVTGLSLTLEYLTGSETVGMDNFCITNLPPIANFSGTPTLAFPGDPVYFTDLSTKGPTSWSWNFGDAGSSNLKHPEHIYQNPGIYDVSLVVTNHFGSDNISKSSYIEIVDDTQCLRFEDDFNDGSINSLWKIRNGTWSESGGIIRQTSNYYTGNYLGGCYATVGGQLWQDYVLACSFLSTDNDGIGFVFNYQDDLNMYMFVWRLETNERILYRWQNGVSTVLDQDNIPYAMNTWYDAEIASISGNISVKIDGLEIFNVDDNTFTTGQAGLYCWANQQSHYDNFSVRCAGVKVGLTALLEGPFQTTHMTTDLNSNDLLPLSQPYGGSPWNYAGFENVISIPNSNVTDWVLVELRDAVNAASAVPATIVGQKAAFILHDGSIVDLDGVSALRFSIDVQNQLFAIVRHRNHLPVMSASPLVLSGEIFNHDFTTGVGQAYGTDAQKDLGGGKSGLFAGDLNADGLISTDDKLNVWTMEAGLNGYLPSDINLDGEADNLDKNDIWLNNIGKGEILPN
jgi:PKD repeat protein